MKENNLIKISTFFVLALAIISLTSAFSVSRDYLENNQMNMTVGETKPIQFVLQNGGSTEPINVQVKILNGSEIIKITDASDVYLVNPGDKIPVNFLVNISEEANFGEVYKITIEFNEASLNQNTLSIGTGIEQSFNVFLAKTSFELERDKKRKNMQINALIIGILFILIILILIIIKVKKRKTR